MAKKYIDVMDTTFRDGFQSVFGGRVLMDDFLPAVAAARDAGISHFELLQKRQNHYKSKPLLLLE